MIKIKDLFFNYGRDDVLKDINWDVASSEFWGIIGPNGSGKSTLIKCMSKILQGYKGCIYLEGTDIKNISLKDISKKIAFVPEESNTEFSFKAIEIVLMGRYPHLKRFELEKKQDLDIARRCMEMTKSRHLDDRFIDELSSGERQRVIIARALAQQTELLILDEPTSHLDINFEIEIFDLLKRLQREQGMTVISVLHNLNLASQYCDKILLLDLGRMSVFGWPEDVITRDNIRSVYGVDVFVGKDPVSGKPWVFPRRTDISD